MVKVLFFPEDGCGPLVVAFWGAVGLCPFLHFTSVFFTLSLQSKYTVAMLEINSLLEFLSFLY